MPERPPHQLSLARLQLFGIITCMHEILHGCMQNPITHGVDPKQKSTPYRGDMELSAHSDKGGMWIGGESFPW